LSKNIKKLQVKSLVYNKKTLVRKKEDKDYTKSQKQLLVSVIMDYSLFGYHDEKIIKMLSKIHVGICFLDTYNLK
jgi:hypothetical protein